MDINKYVARIGFKGDISADEKCLKELHRCHVMSIPFEALAIHYGEPILLDLNSIFQKVIRYKRGGYCYELNYLFHWLLTQIGFKSHLISASIFDKDGFGPKYDHMAVFVELSNDWLIDVGYGDSFINPLKIEIQTIQEDKFKLYKISEHNKNEYLLLETLKAHDNWVKRYSFSLRPCKIDEFEEQNEYKQTSSDSYFVRNKICTLPTPLGRKTILNNTYKIRVNNKVQEFGIESDKEMKQILNDEFNMTLE